MALRTFMILGLTASMVIADEPKRTVEQLENEIKSKLSRVKSLKATLIIDTEMVFDEYRYQSFDSGTFEYVVKKGNTVFRKELTTYEVSEAQDKRSEKHGSHLTISDGKMSFGVREVRNKQTAYKMKQLEQYGTDPFMELRTNGDITVRPDAKVDDHDCHVVRTTPTAAHGDTTISGYVNYFFDKKLGVLRRYTAYGPENQQMRVVTFSEFKINEPIDPERLKFKPPVGVSIVDLTKYGN